MKAKHIAKSVVTLAACIGMIIPGIPVSAADCEFRTGDDGKLYWFEAGVKQGTLSDTQGILGDGTNRGREIFDSATNGWYWLDSVYDGAKAVGKEVWIPYIYQDELVASPDGNGRMANGISDEARVKELAQASITSEADMSAQVEAAIKNKTGKWVRYDENGAMLKGWVKIQGALEKYYTDQVGNIYYYDQKTGLMAKGDVTINGVQYHFDETTGVIDDPSKAPDINTGLESSDSQQGSDTTDNGTSDSQQGSDTIDNGTSDSQQGSDTTDNGTSDTKQTDQETTDKKDTTDDSQDSSKSEKTKKNVEYVVFGSYEQDNDDSNGKEPIEWMVLDENENGKLLISRYVLDRVEYNTEYTDVTWETCSLREWLNEDFLNSAFTAEEQAKIATANLVNADNAYYGVDGGNDTKDKIFCLSLDEMFKYFEFDHYDESSYSYCQDLIAPATSYAISNRAMNIAIEQDVYDRFLKDYGYTTDCVGMSGSYWWLRSPGLSGGYACTVTYDGCTGSMSGDHVDIDEYVGVRPALYISK